MINKQFLPATPASVNYHTLKDTARKYARTMDLWLEMRSAIDLNAMEVKYEDLVADPETQSKQIFGFLGLAWESKVLDYHQHVLRKRVRSPTYHAVAKPIYQTATQTWKNHESLFEPIDSILRPYLDAFGYT